MATAQYGPPEDAKIKHKGVHVGESYPKSSFQLQKQVPVYAVDKVPVTIFFAIKPMMMMMMMMMISMSISP